MTDVNRLFEKCGTAIKEIGTANFEKHLDKIISRKGKKVKNQVIECIISTVSVELGVITEDLLKGTGEEPSFALSVTYYLVKQHTHATYKVMAKYFERTSHGPIHKRIMEINALTPNGVEKDKFERLKKVETKLEIELKKLM